MLARTLQRSEKREGLVAKRRRPLMAFGSAVAGGGLLIGGRRRSLLLVRGCRCHYRGRVLGTEVEVGVGSTRNWS